MTTRELSELSALRREIEHDRERLAELRSDVYPSTSLSGAPGGHSGVSRVELTAVRCAELEDMIRRKVERCEAELMRLETYIQTVPDSAVRLALVLRYIDGLTWDQTAAHIGGGNTADGVRKMVVRYLDGEKEEESDA